jgi:hypothetical protein
MKAPLLMSVMFGVMIASPAFGQDDTVDWLLKTQTTTAPASRPATTRPAGNVLERTSSAGEEAVRGVVTLSDGRKIEGTIATTPGKPLRVWVAAKSQYVDFALSEVSTLEAKVLWERDEREWHFIASGSDVKEYTGKTYPARELQYAFTLQDGRSVTGGVVAPLYVESDTERSTLVLTKRDKGPVGSTLARLVYVKSAVIERSKP